MPRIDAGGFVLLPDEGRRTTMGPFDIRFLATREETDGAFALIESFEPDPAPGPPLHIHRDASESFFVVAGAYWMHVSGRDFHCPPGSFIHVPRNTPHTFRVLEPNSRKLNLFVPAAMEGYFVELAEAIRGGVGAAGMEEIAERYQMEVLGPAPEGYLNRRG